MGRKGRRREKPCDACGATGPVLYRVSVAVQQPEWVFMCPTCQRRAETQPHYRYGGTWKARKRS
ncbi:MAG: hypothetical protein AAGN82_22065 [Myxococcota bacterium]